MSKCVACGSSSGNTGDKALACWDCRSKYVGSCVVCNSGMRYAEIVLCLSCTMKYNYRCCKCDKATTGLDRIRLCRDCANTYMHSIF